MVLKCVEKTTLVYQNYELHEILSVGFSNPTKQHTKNYHWGSAHLRTLSGFEIADYCEFALFSHYVII